MKKRSAQNYHFNILTVDEAKEIANDMLFKASRQIGNSERVEKFVREQYCGAFLTDVFDSRIVDTMNSTAKIDTLWGMPVLVQKEDEWHEGIKLQDATVEELLKMLKKKIGEGE